MRCVSTVKDDKIVGSISLRKNPRIIGLAPALLRTEQVTPMSFTLLQYVGEKERSRRHAGHYGKSSYPTELTGV
jgi:hypothetical protein